MDGRGDPASCRRTSSISGGRLKAAIVVLAMVAVGLSPVAGLGARRAEGLSAPTFQSVGDIDPETGFPIWYGDANGTKLQLCLDSATLCLVPAPDPTVPPRVPSNFADETFYWSAEASVRVGTRDAVFTLAQEGAFANGDVAVGDQVVFTRLRIRVPNLRAGSVYTVTHPYGVETFTATPVRIGATVGEINTTLDVGCGVTVPCDFSTAVSPGGTSQFLSWDPAVLPLAPAGHLGDPSITHAVTGSPNGTNFIRVQGPGLVGGQVFTDQFAVQGQLLTPRIGPDLALRNPTGAIDFGTTKVDESGVVRSVTLVSNGTLPLTITGINLDPNGAPAYVLDDTGTCLVAPLDPGQTCTATVRFAPVSAIPGAPTPADLGLRTGDLVVASDDASAGGTSTIHLSGIAARLDAAALAARVGPVDPEHGFPVTYTDDAAFTLGTGVDNRLELCLAGDPNGLAPLCLAPAPDPSVPSTVDAVPGASNFAEEGFWWAADADLAEAPGRAQLVMALEAAFLGGEPLAGDGQAFGRIRIRFDALRPNELYTVTFPYGTRVLRADTAGSIFHTEDIGCMDLPSPAPTPGFNGVNRCDFTMAFNSPILSSFLRWDSSLPAPPPGYLGDPNTPHTVTGSPTGNNFFSVTGPGLLEGGLPTDIGTLTSDLFTVSGKLAQPLVPRPDDRFAFGAHAGGTRVVQIWNDSDSDVESIGLALSGPAATEFVVAADQCPAIAAHSSCDIEAAFSATPGAGLRVANLEVTPTIAGQAAEPLIVELAGRGPALGVSPTTVTFADQNIGTTSVARAVTVTNAGPTALTMLPSLTGANPTDFTFSGCAAAVAPLGTCTLSVRFIPSAVGPRSATLAVTGGGETASAALNGTGVAPSVTVTPASVTFPLPATAVGATSAPQTVTVRNTGTAATVVTATSSSTEFPVTSSTCGTLAPDATCNVGVSFRPLSAGSRAGSLTIGVPAPGLPLVVPLTGTAEVRDITPPNVVAGANRARFSPNDDGAADTMTVTASFNESVTWTFEVRNSANTVVRTISGSTNVIPGSNTTPVTQITWDGRNSANTRVADGNYTWRLTARDAAGNASTPTAVPVAVDTVAANVSLTRSTGSIRPSRNETVTFTVNVNEGATASIEIRSGTGANGTLVRTLGPVTRTNGGNLALVWNGRNNAGAIVAIGTYTARPIVRDQAENLSVQRSISVTVR